VAFNKTEIIIFAILVILVIGIFYFSALRGTAAEMIVIGDPDPNTLEIIKGFRAQGYPEFSYILKPQTQEFLRNADKKISKYRVYLLYQVQDKRLPRDLADAIVSNVKKGKTLIVVKNSGVFSYDLATRSLGHAGTVGWKATFRQDIMPVSCEPFTDQSPCLREVPINARIRIIKENIYTKGVEQVPALDTMPPLSLTVLPIQNLEKGSEELAFVEVEGTGDNFVGVAHKKLGLGHVFYFNYEPAATPSIFQNVVLLSSGK